MKHQEIRQKFLDYFSSRDHKVVPSSSLVPPVEDETVLLTTAGMQQFKHHIQGERDAVEDFGRRRLVSVQKCFRTSDIEEVGGKQHLTFFEMLGNFSINGYFKDVAIPLAWKFLTEELRLKPKNMYVSFFAGDERSARDSEAEKIWKHEAPGVKIKEAGREELFWGPVGASGPCGPSSEIHYILEDGTDIELWNLVFMEHFCSPQGKITPLPSKNIDTGMGMERLAMVLQNKKDIFSTDLFAPIISDVRRLARVAGSSSRRSLRIVADHTRAAAFLIADGVRSSNLGRGYVLRKVIRRAVLHGYLMGINGYFLRSPLEKVIEAYGEFYPELAREHDAILSLCEEEEVKFGKALIQGEREFKKQGKKADAFKLYDTYGLPLEITKELAKKSGVKIDEEEFNRKLGEQQAQARRAQKSRGEVSDDLIAPQHTAAHLLNAALIKVLGPTVRQAGQNISADGFRHDFTYHRKLGPEELSNLEKQVNEQIKKDIPVVKEETTYEQAVAEGAQAWFKEKYLSQDKVTLYRIGDFSKELCAGPHVKSTAQLNGFRITKETSAGAGVRRIYGKALAGREA